MDDARRLVSDSGGDPVTRRVLAAVVDVAHLLGRQVVALGVGDEPTLARLGDLGVDACQGFYLCHPQPLTQLLAQKL